MAIEHGLILRILQSARGKALGVEEILERGHLNPGEKPAVRQALRHLSHEGSIEQDGKRFRAKRVEPPPAPPPPKRAVKSGASVHGAPATIAPPLLARRAAEGSNLFDGTLTRHPDGYGFIAPLHGGDDLFVPPQAMGDAMDGDLVRARPGPGRDGRPVAKTLEVLERRRQYAVGTYRLLRGGRGHAIVEPRDRQLGQGIEVPVRSDLEDGDVVRVHLTEVRGGEVRGAIVSKLGLPGDPNVEVLSVAYGEGFADVFPADTVAAAEAVPDHVRAEDKTGRRDLTGLDLVTIDGEDARDFDDAVYVERTTRGYRLVVAIADVTAYVTAGGALDREALRRTTSVYFPRHVLPMLPERLSNGICSLNPKVERLCMVADIALDESGQPLDTEVYPGVMLSRARCTYTQVAALVDGKPVPELDHVKDMLLLSAELASKMTRVRMLRGAIDFDIPESHIVLDEEGMVKAIDRRARNLAHRLIEEFMLAANEAVARYFESRALPTVYRVHGAPKEQKLAAFVDLAKAFGYDVRTDQAGKVSAAELNVFLHRVEGRPEQRALNHLLLRSMMQAVYSAENIGHFGLAAESYLHFTSPIRRYPDLVVHRLLKEHWARGGRVLPEPERKRQGEDLEAVAVHCSERERAATNAEREIDAFYAASYMKQFVGDRFQATIASVAEFGLFCEIQNPFVEGLVRADSLGGTWTLDERHHRLVSGSKSYGVGDVIEVEVASADPILRRIELRAVVGGRTLDRTSPEDQRRWARDAISRFKEKSGRGPARKPEKKQAPARKDDRGPKKRGR